MPDRNLRRPFADRLARERGQELGERPSHGDILDAVHTLGTQVAGLVTEIVTHGVRSEERHQATRELVQVRFEAVDERFDRVEDRLDAGAQRFREIEEALAETEAERTAREARAEGRREGRAELLGAARWAASHWKSLAVVGSLGAAALSALAGARPASDPAVIPVPPPEPAVLRGRYE